jgi:hypothetical protein
MPRYHLMADNELSEDEYRKIQIQDWIESQKNPG